ncbi:hypothetical protein HN51_021798 [Arachis hypogaea]
MNPFHLQSVPSTHPLGSLQFPMLPPEPPNSIHFGKIEMQKEQEMLMMIKDGKVSLEDVKHGSNEPCLSCFLECLQDIRVNKESQELLAVEVRNYLMSKLRSALEPFRYVANEASP